MRRSMWVLMAACVSLLAFPVVASADAAEGFAQAAPIAAPVQAPATAPSAAGPVLPPPAAPAVANLDAKTSAYLVLDMVNGLCNPKPSCVASIPAAASLLKKARAAGVPVMYSTVPIPGVKIVPPLAPQAGEPTVVGWANKFTGTKLDQMLKAKGIKTVVIVGTAANGAVMYTAYDANSLGYEVVVATDGISSGSTLDTSLAEYQLLHQPGHGNPSNALLSKDAQTHTPAVTLSTSDLITFH